MTITDVERCPWWCEDRLKSDEEHDTENGAAEALSAITARRDPLNHVAGKAPGSPPKSSFNLRRTGTARQ